MSNPLTDTSDLPRFADIKPEHAVPALRELISAHRQKLAALLSDSTLDQFDSLVAPLEEMSHELSRVWSPVSHLQMVLDDPGWRDAYNAALPLMTEHGTELSQNKDLQEAYQRVADAMPAEDKTARHALVKQELRDFHLSGVALPEDKKTRYKELMQELAAAQAKFDQNVQDSTDAWHFQTGDEDQLSGLPQSTKTRAAQDAKDQGESGWWLKLDFPNYHAVMTHADKRGVRESFYRAWATRASDQSELTEFDNSGVIEQILTLRHEAASLVGFSNFAEYSLATKMAGNVDEVLDFLRELAKRTRSAALAEFEQIQAMVDEPLQAWDVSYYLEKLKVKKFSISDEELRQYFPSHGVKQGLFELAERLYGISVSENDAVTGWHDTVKYYEVRDAEQSLLGSFYTDLFARRGKRGGAWMDECVIRKNLFDENITPVGYLICNFSPPDDDGVSLLTHDDVVTVFHEFGHMLHHLLTRVDYPSIAGINGVPWDAVELPSQFMENFAWHYDVLAKSSAHKDTGDPLPKDVFDRLQNSRYFGEGLAMLRQIEFALFDFRLHAEFDLATGAKALDVLAEVRSEVALVHYPDYNRQPHSFSHIFAGGYAAGYYSYKWAEVLAADAFAAFEENGIFDTETAARFRQEILEVGGSRDFMEAYIAFRGRKPTMDALLAQCGIGKAA